MPHDQPWFDDYQAKCQAELQKKWDEDAKVFNVHNRAMRTVLNECPFPLRTPETCQECGNEACVKAYKEQNEIWGEDDQSEPVFHANTAKKHQEPQSPLALVEKTASTESQRPGRPASGSEPDLFTLMARQLEDEEMAA